MKANYFYLTLTSLCIFSSGLTYAQSGAHYGQPVQPATPSNSGAYYGDSNESYSFGNKDFSVSVKVPNRHDRSRRGIAWVEMRPGYPLPPTAVIGGYEPNQQLSLYVCRGNYNGAMHPGKLIGGKCNIGWGGNEIRLGRYQVLVSRRPLNWIPANGGFIPANAIQAGVENGKPLYVCQATFNGGLHPGKLIGQTCNIGWGGKEILMPTYNVLVR